MPHGARGQPSLSWGSSPAALQTQLSLAVLSCFAKVLPIHPWDAGRSLGCGQEALLGWAPSLVKSTRQRAYQLADNHNATHSPPVLPTGLLPHDPALPQGCSRAPLPPKH